MNHSEPEHNHHEKIIEYFEREQKRHEKRKYELRSALLKIMDEYMHDMIEDEDNVMPWLALCIPDEALDEEFDDFAKDEELWHNCLEMFAKYVKIDECGNDSEAE